jgi:hypothetical protein
LQAWNYPLSDVALLVLSPATADQPTRPDAGAADSTCDVAGQITDSPEAEEVEPVRTPGDPDLAA